MKLFVRLCFLLLCTASYSQTVLFFVSHEETYYSEYIVVAEALEAAGYTVEVRSASAMNANTYMLPSGTDIEATANTLANSSYSDFTAKFQALTGASWNASVNAVPGSGIAVHGRIQDVASMEGYAALVIAGGTGALAYRVDGNYSIQGAGGRTVSASDVQAAAEKLNALALEALAGGKPVLAQCHAASLPAFWRIPGTSGPGEEILGYSLLKGQQAAGYPEAATSTTLLALDVTYKAEDRVTVSGSHDSFSGHEQAAYKIITSRDWYPQTVLYAATTLINTIETYPPIQFQELEARVLILHGGAVDPANCGAGNKANDVPCNYGTGADLPADYTDVVALLHENSLHDAFLFGVSELNLAGTLPFDLNNESEIRNYLDNYEVVVFYKHWSTFVTDALQNALVSYADENGGVLGIHHGLYNDIDGVLNKDILAEDLFGAESAMNTWSANRTTYDLFNTSYGHFITTFGIQYGEAATAPSVWNTNALLSSSNASYSTYPNFEVFDELYNNMSFLPGQTFGKDVNEIMSLLSNDQTPAGQCHTSGFLKRFNPSLDATEGRVAYFEAGERPEVFTAVHSYGQVLRNAVCWLAQPRLIVAGTKEEWLVTGETNIQAMPNPTKGEIAMELPSGKIYSVVVRNTMGQVLMQHDHSTGVFRMDLSSLISGLYYIVMSDEHGTQQCVKVQKY